VGFERVVERRMIEVAQIATKPDKGRGHGNDWIKRTEACPKFAATIDGLGLK
jgi:hypothetical protein